MNNSAGCIDNSKPDASNFSDLEAAKLLLEEWKFRQTHAWSSLTRYFLAAVIVSTVPYVLKEDLATRLHYVLLLFPVLGALLGLAAVWVYGAEYVRAQSPNHRYKHLLEKYEHWKQVEWKGFDALFNPRIGRATVYVLGVATVVLAITNFTITWSFVSTPTPGVPL